jgi:hypothetical protein
VSLGLLSRTGATTTPSTPSATSACPLKTRRTTTTIPTSTPPPTSRAHILILHGTGDDNVHIENDTQYIQKLIEAGIPYDYNIYPRKTHSVSGVDDQTELYAKILDHFERYLINAKPAETKPAETKPAEKPAETSRNQTSRNQPKPNQPKPAKPANPTNLPNPESGAEIRSAQKRWPGQVHPTARS